MPKRNSTLKPQPKNTSTLRISPRLHPNNQSPPLDPKTPEPRSRSRRFVPEFSPLSNAEKGFDKNVSKKIEESKCGFDYLRKLNNGLTRSGKEIGDFCVRRSPRLSGEEHVIDQKEGFNEKKQRRVLKMEVGFDSGKQGEVKSGINKRVLRSSNRENADEISKKINVYQKVYPDAESATVPFDCDKEDEGKKRVTRGSIKENAYEILKKTNVYNKGLPDAERAVVGFDSSKQTEGKSVTAKRVTRSAIRGNADEMDEKGNKCKKGLSDIEGAKRGFDLGKQAVRGIKIEKKVMRGSIRGNTDDINKNKCNSEKGLLDVERSLSEVKSCGGIRGKLEDHTDESSLIIERTNVGTLTDEKEKDFDKCMQTIGVKRKRNRDGEGHGWTQDQELALQRAYFAAKPTPKFWKRVSKLVPGKSAQDCFNKINADHLTPPQLRTRSRATNTNVSSFALSASKLLKPEDSKIGKITRRKQNRHLAQKTVRHILQKHYNVDQDYEADLFSVLESTFSPSTKSLECGGSYSTPQGEKHSCGFLKVCNDKSSSGRKKRFSRLSGSKGECLVSPPVLKPVKNKALHEKYIDHLHCRDAKRKVACRKENSKKKIIQKTEPIKLLKDALVWDAKDFIHKFQHRKDSAKREYSDDDDENEGLEEEDEED